MLPWISLPPLVYGRQIDARSLSNGQKAAKRRKMVDDAGKVNPAHQGLHVDDAGKVNPAHMEPEAAEAQGSSAANRKAVRLWATVAGRVGTSAGPGFSPHR